MMFYRYWFVAVAMISLHPGQALSTGETPATESEPAKIVGDMKKAFMSVLSTELAKGPENALSACKIKAPTIPAQFKDVSVGRTTNKPRNAVNTPKSWMQSFLNKGAKTTADNPLKPETVILDGNRRGYFEPIYIAPMCITCHGEAIDMSLKKKIDELYPKDLATGYKVKDFRGAFWVEFKQK